MRQWAIVGKSVFFLRVSQTIEETLIGAMQPGIAPKDLWNAVRAVHPEATKKEIMLAAFAAMIVLAENDPGGAKALHDFALAGRKAG